MSRVKILSGEKVSLVTLEKQDIDLWYAGMNNLETIEFLGKRRDIYYKEDIERLYEDTIGENDSTYFSIYCSENKKVIGICCIKDIRDLSRQGELYLFIYDKKNHNKGYGSEIVKLLIKYGFEILGLNKITLSYIEGNKYANELYSKHGFKEVGRFKEDEFVRGKLKDQIFMEIYKKDYK